jgi:hypothetical protein
LQIKSAILERASEYARDAASVRLKAASVRTNIAAVLIFLASTLLLIEIIEDLLHALYAFRTRFHLERYALGAGCEANALNLTSTSNGSIYLALVTFTASHSNQLLRVGVIGPALADRELAIGGYDFTLAWGCVGRRYSKGAKCHQKHE